MKNWQPILSGEVRLEARRAVDDIRRHLAELPVGYDADIRGASVLDVGRLGQAIFWLYLAEVDDDEGALDRAMACLEEAGDELARVVTAPTLYAGFLGSGWVMEYLQRQLEALEDSSTEAEAQQEDEDDEDPNGDIDEALLDSLRSGVSNPNLSLFGGLVGSGVYALERLPRASAQEILERLVDRLMSLAEPLPGGLSWRTPPELLPEKQRRRCPNGYFNLGLGHGVPGVIALLAAILRAGVATAQVRELLEPAVAWLLAARLEEQGRLAYPRFLLEGKPGEGVEQIGGLSSLAWCFGDPGVAVALLAAGRALGDEECEAVARRLARDVAERPEVLGGIGPDPGFCHGASGTAHVFNRLYQFTGEQACARAARLELRRLLERREFGDSATGFLTVPMSPHVAAPGEKAEVREVGGLLRGVAGVGLTLLAAVTDRAPGWDRLMLLSACK